MRTPTEQPSETSRAGFIIVALLWILAALAALVSAYAIYVMNTARSFNIHADRIRTEALVSAALELTAYELTGTSAQSQPTHGSFNFQLGNADIAVRFQSEAARIDLNAAPKELLAGLFMVLGVSSDLAANYAERVARWRTPPTQSENAFSTIHVGDVKYAPRGAPFPHINELALVPGLPIRVVEQALPFLTIYSGLAQVNILEAPPRVLAALPGITQDRLNAVVAQRQTAGDQQILLQLLGPSGRFATAEAGKGSRVSIRITQNKARRSFAEGVIVPFEQGPEPYAVLSWQDQADSADVAAGAEEAVQ
jgi:general secretion pathway protein K